MTLRPLAIWWAALVAGLGAVGVWLGSPYDVLWRSGLLLLVVGLFAEYLLANRLALRVAVVEKGALYLGEVSEFRLSLQNNSPKPHQLKFAAFPPLSFAGVSPTISRSLAPGDQLQVDVSMIAQQLGAHRWPPQPVEINGLFGLARWVRKFPAQANADDAPAVSHVEAAMLPAGERSAATEDFGQRTAARRGVGGSEFHALRPYVPGDDAARVDWKASARAMDLVVRETQQEQQLLLYFVIDCGRGSGLTTGRLNALGHSVNLAARMSQLADHAGDRYGLLAYTDQPDVQLAPGRGPAHQMAFRQRLNALQVSEVQSNQLAAVMALQGALPRRALVLFFTHLDDAETTGQLAQAVRLLRPRHLPMVVAVEDRSVRDLIAGPVADQNEMFTALAAAEYRRTVDQTRQRLERLGATVVEARPEQLEAQVFSRYRSLRARNQI